MKKLRLWALCWRFVVASCLLLSFGISVAEPAGAPILQPTLVPLDQPVTVNGITCRYRLEGPVPSSSTKTKFSSWNNMQPRAFTPRDENDTHLELYFRQCRATVGTPDWLTDPVCDSYKENLEAGNCAVEMVNHVKWDVVRGKEKVTGKSVPYANQHMKLKEPRQTIFVPMPDNIWLGAFAGEEESCNNFAALKEKELLSPPAAPVKKRYKEGNCRFVRKEQRQLPSTFTHVSDFHYCGCDIPGFTGVTPSGVQSTSSYVCD